MIGNLILYLSSFLGVWIGSGLTVKSVETISRKLKTSSFLVSFILLGLFTSIGEISVGVNSLIKNTPEIFVGNLVGASIVIFMLIIPLLAIVSKSIHVTPEFRGFNLPASLIVVALPSLTIMDGKITQADSIITIALFIFLLINIQSKKNLINQAKKIGQSKSKISKDIQKMIFGIVVIFISSYFIVEQTVYFAQILKISPFIISLLITSLGTNIPELSLIIRSVIIKNNQVAFGNYIGSASFNSLMMGILSLVYGKTLILSNSYLISLIFLIVNLLLFYRFAKTKNTISVKEGLLLLLLYFAFLFVEIYSHFINP